jgi:hypothetical protein
MPVWTMVRAEFVPALTIALTQTGFPPSLLLRRDFSEARRAKESLALTLADHYLT